MNRLRKRIKELVGQSPSSVAYLADVTGADEADVQRELARRGYSAGAGRSGPAALSRRRFLHIGAGAGAMLGLPPLIAGWNTKTPASSTRARQPSFILTGLARGLSAGGLPSDEKGLSELQADSTNATARLSARVCALIARPRRRQAWPGQNPSNMLSSKSLLHLLSLLAP